MLFQKVAVNISLKKDQILRRKIQHIPVKKAIIFVQLLRPQVAVRNNHSV